MTPRHLTFWLTLGGLLIRGRLGAYLWLVCGFGYTGILWERLSGSTLHRHNDWTALTRQGAASHVPQLLLGLYRLERGRR